MSEWRLSADEDMEILRKKSRNRLYTVFILTGLFFLLFLVLAIWMELLNSTEELLGRIFLVFFIPVASSIPIFTGLFYLIANRPYNRYSNAYKERYVLKIISDAWLFEQVSYDPKGGFTYDEICRAALIYPGMEHYFQSEDMVRGSYKAIDFSFCDVVTRRMVKRGKSARVETIFSGQIIRFSSFDDRKTSSGFVQIYQKNFFSDLKGWTADYKIEMEDAGFNKRFDIYATDEHNAYYILTPRLMEKIVEFADQAGAQIAISFLGHVMYVAVNRKQSMFDPQVDRPVAEQKQNILNDMKLLLTAGDILLCRRMEGVGYER